MTFFDTTKKNSFSPHPYSRPNGGINGTKRQEEKQKKSTQKYPWKCLCGMSLLGFRGIETPSLKQTKNKNTSFTENSRVKRAHVKRKIVFQPAFFGRYVSFFFGGVSCSWNFEVITGSKGEQGLDPPPTNLDDRESKMQGRYCLKKYHNIYHISIYVHPRKAYQVDFDV